MVVSSQYIQAHFSNNFIRMSVDESCKTALSIIEAIKPEYVLFSRLYQGESIKYVFLGEVLKDFLFHVDATDLSKTIIEVLDLHEEEQNETSQISDDTPHVSDSKTLEIISKFQDEETLVPVSYNGRVTNIYDPLRNNSDASYHVKDFSARRAFGPPGLPTKDYRLETSGEDLTPYVSKGKTRGGISDTDDAPQKIQVEKYAEAVIDDHLKLEKRSPFQIMLKGSPSKSTSGSPIVLGASPGQKTIDLNVIVKCEPPGAVEFSGGYHAPLPVPVDGDSEALLFWIVPKKKGPCNIIASFYEENNNLPAGMIKVHTEIVTEDIQTTQKTIRGTIEATPNLIGPDVIIDISKDGDTPLKYQMLVFASPIGHPKLGGFSIMMQGEPETQYRAIFQSIEQIAKANNFNPVLISRKIAAKGESLYDQLIPEPLKEFLWTNKDKIHSIQITTDEPWIPWELIKPYKKTNGNSDKEPFLCEKYAMSRWISNTGTKHKESIKNIKVVLPVDTNLNGARSEALWIESFAGPLEIDVEKLSSLEQVLASLTFGNFDLMHFSTHGNYNSQLSDLSEVSLEGGQTLQPEDVGGSSTNFANSNPLIILNACQTQQHSYSLTGLGGWAKRFLDAGSFGFIGTHWSINDDTAELFTRRLYEFLRNGKSLDESLRLTRKAIKDDGDPSWLAYALYAPANAIIKMGN